MWAIINEKLRYNLVKDILLLPIYSTGPFEGIAYCVRVAECVDNYRNSAYMYRSGYLQGAGAISTSDAKPGEPFLKAKVSMLSASVTSFGGHSTGECCGVREESALVCQSPELGIASPSVCRCLYYDVLRCQDVNKTMN